MRRRIIHPVRECRRSRRFGRGDQKGKPRRDHQHGRRGQQRSFLQAVKAWGSRPSEFPSCRLALPKMNCAGFRFLTWLVITRPGTISSRLTGPRIGRLSRDSRQCTVQSRVDQRCDGGCILQRAPVGAGRSRGQSEEVPEYSNPSGARASMLQKGSCQWMMRLSIHGGPCLVGQIRADGQFDLVWSSEKPVRPIPYPSSRSHAEWDAFLDGLIKVGVVGQTQVLVSSRRTRRLSLSQPHLRRFAL